MKNEIVYNIKIKDCRRVQYDSYILLTAFWQYEDFREWFNWCFVFLSCLFYKWLLTIFIVHEIKLAVNTWTTFVLSLLIILMCGSSHSLTEKSVIAG